MLAALPASCPALDIARDTAGEMSDLYNQLLPVLKAVFTSKVRLLEAACLRWLPPIDHTFACTRSSFPP